MKNMKRGTRKLVSASIFLVGFLVCFLSFVTIASGMIEEYGDSSKDAIKPHNLLTNITSGDGGKPPAASREKAQQTPQYVPGEVLVKFKEGADPQSVLHSVGIESKSIERVHSILPAVAKFKKDYKLEKTSDGWYPFLGKNYKEVADIPDEDLFKEIYKNMSEIEKPLYRSYKIELPEGMSVEETIAKLKENPDIEYAEPNYIYHLQMVPKDPYYQSSGTWGQPYDDLWGLKKIQCEQAWDSRQGENIIVAVIDSGVDYHHPDIWKNVWVNPALVPDVNGDGVRDLDDVDTNHNKIIEPLEIKTLQHYPQFDVIGRNFAGVDTYMPMDRLGHGTHVAGTIAATGNNGIGVIGVSPRARIMILKVGGDQGTGLDASACASAIRYAQQNGARVLSLSWGGYTSSYTVKDAIDVAYKAGCVIVAAAGNESTDVPMYPASFDNVISIGATDYEEHKTDFSNWGPNIDVTAPGEGILSLRAKDTDMYALGGQPGIHIVANDYYYADGTSMACPHVSGLVALLLSENSNLTPEQVKWLLRNSTQTIETYPGFFNLYQGYGRIDAQSALQKLQNVPTETLPKASIQGYADWSNIVYQDKLTFSGIATSSHFVDYVISYIPCDKLDDPTSWVELYRSTTAVPTTAKLCEIDMNLLQNGPGLFGIKVNDALYGSDYDFVSLYIYHTVNEEPGWPVVGAFQDIEPNIADLDGDGDLEIMAVGRSMGVNRLYIRHHDGSPLQGWENGREILGTPQGSVSVADLDKDGYLEIVLAAGDMSQYTFRVYVWRHDGTNFPNWPRSLYWRDCYDSRETTPAIGDLDGDGDLEIVVSLNGDGCFRDGMNDIYAFHHNGRNLSGWPIDIPGYYVIHSSPTLGDLNGDGKLEVAVATRQNADQNIGALFVYDFLGHLVNGWPIQTTFKTYKSPVMGDIDNDGLAEVIVSDYNSGVRPRLSNLYVLDGNGNNKAGWPRSVGLYGSLYLFSEPALADIDQDGKPEIIIYVFWEKRGEEFINMLYIFNEDGSIEKGWEVDLVTNSSFVVGDIDADNDLEIIASGVDGKVWIYHHDGKLVDGWPIWTFRGSNWDQTPALGDIDSDGKLELVVQSERLHVWELGENRNPALNKVWPLYRHDSQHTGCYNSQYPIITNIFPSSAYRGGTVTITGYRFGSIQGNGFVEFSNGMKAQIQSWSDTKIICIVPQGARSGEVFVITAEGRKSNKVGITIIDTTPPTTPVVSDEGEFTTSTTQLFASWTSQDNESGIVEYQYRTTQDSTTGAVIKNWTSTGTNTSVTVTALSLQSGKTYYFGVKAKNGAGLWSEVGYSDGITVEENKPPDIYPSIGSRPVNIGSTLVFTVSATDPNKDPITYQIYQAGDVNHDNHLTPLDALILINTLNKYGSGIKPGDKGWNPEMDVADPYGSITDSDPKFIINMLNKGIITMPIGPAINTSTGYFTWTPNLDQIGTHYLTFVASDGKLTDAEVVAISVTLSLPQITSVSPATASIGSSITITGKYFGSSKNAQSNALLINNITATDIQSWSDTQITCRIPPNAQSGQVRIATLGGKSNGVNIVVSQSQPQPLTQL